MKTHPACLVLFGLLALFMGGCATRYEVRVDALSTGQGAAPGSGLTYALASGTPAVEASDLFFKEVARHLEPVLMGRGYWPAGEGAPADIRIEVDAHLSEPLVETRSYSEPVYLDSGPYLQAYRVPVLNDKGQVVRFQYVRYWEPSRVQFAGWVNRDQQVTVYDKVLRLSARRILGDGQLSDELWTVKVALRDRGTDYRAALPYLLVAAGPYIGQRTEGEVVIVLREDAPEVQSYKAGLGGGR